MRRFVQFAGAAAVVISGLASGSHAQVVTAGTPGQLQLPQTGTSLILGQIVDVTGAPVEDASVVLSGGLVPSGGVLFQPAPVPGGPRRTLTNHNGHFVFANLPAGSYSIDASRTGYLPGAFGRRRPSGLAQSITLAEGEANGAVKITIWKYGYVSGTVVDEGGDPIVGIYVTAYRRNYDTGRGRFALGYTGVTDDRGLYRTQLSPGDYVVAVTSTHSTMPAGQVEAYLDAVQAGNTADLSRTLNAGGVNMSSLTSPGTRVGDFIFQSRFESSLRSTVEPPPTEDGRLQVYPTTFHPNTIALAQARVLTVASGADMMGVDIQMRALPASRIVGKVVGPDGPVANLGVRLVSNYVNDLVFEGNLDVAQGSTDATGAFTFLGIPAGQYTVRALKLPVSTPPPPGAPSTPPGGNTQGPTLWANVPVTVDENVPTAVTVTLARGFRVSGRFEFDGTIAKPSASTIQNLVAQVHPMDGHTTDSRLFDPRPSASGEFVSFEMPPGKYSIRMASFDWPGMSTWAYKSSELNGRDVAGAGLDVDSDISGVVITMTDHPTEVRGLARDAQGRLDATAAVVLFSTNRSDWTNFGNYPRRLRNLRASNDGRYRTTSLPPGDYYAIAVPDEQVEDYLNPRVLEQLARIAARFTLVDGEKKVLDVTTKSIR